jgi:UDP-2,3-diacylglucosamine pyrophosphatase LpxH
MLSGIDGRAFRRDVTMLVVISDLHLTDGSSGTTISAGAFEIFAERLADLAVQASWRIDGSYRPVEQIDLVLLGDILDVIRSTRWLARDDVRPWTAGAELAQVVTRITQDILSHNAASTAVLRRLATEGIRAVPPTSRLHQPSRDGAGEPIPVRIHYMVGNHDWFFYQRGPAYDSLRQTVIRDMGLANRPDAPFPHDPAESPELLDVLRRHRVFARHGDVFDPFNFEGDRSASSLGDVIVIELVNRFAAEVERELMGDLPASTLAGLKEIDNIRPTLLVPVWIEGLLERSCPFPALRKQVKQTWDRMADRFLSLNFVRERDTWNPNDLVDGLQRALKFSKKISLDWASAITGWLNQWRAPNGDTYFQHALAEQDFRNRRAKFIVYGHTHHVESVPLDASFADGYVLNQTYFNSGTWRRVYRQTRFSPQEHEFIPADEMTYLAFFQADERGGRPYETWSGTLGVNPASLPVHRVDQGRPTDAAHQPVSAPRMAPAAPHFTPAPFRHGIVPTRRK